MINRAKIANYICSEQYIYCYRRVRRFLPCRDPVAGPFPVFRLFDHRRADRIKNHIAADFQKVCVFPNENCLVPALEEVPGLVVTLVASLGKNAIKLSHAEAKISVGSFYHEVVMVVHETISVAEPVVAFIDEDQDFEKSFLEGIGHYQAGRWADAIQSFRKVEELNPGNPIIQRNMRIAERKLRNV